MKNLNKLLILLLLCLLSTTTAVAVEVVTWNYKKINYTNTQGPFTSVEDCQMDLDKFKKGSGLLIETTECTSSADIKKVTTQTTETEPILVAAKINEIKNKSIYTMLAPIGGITCMDSSGKDKSCISNDIGAYLNVIFKLAIGICAALAVIMLIINGVKYMGDESVFGKTEAKKQMFGSIVGLLIALGAWALLNTINPALTGQGGLNISSANIIIDLPEAGDTTVDSNCVSGKAVYSSNLAVSPGVTSALAKLKQGWVISRFVVFAKTNRMLIELKNGSTVDNSNLISIRPGASSPGYSEVGVAEKMKTPKGDWKILNITTPGEGGAVCNSKGSNMGASFWLLNPTKNGERGIGMHGNETGTLSTTAGCVRLANADLLALLPYVKTGLPVIIRD